MLFSVMSIRFSIDCAVIAAELYVETENSFLRLNCELIKIQFTAKVRQNFKYYNKSLL